jgi:hypothetical protein
VRDKSQLKACWKNLKAKAKKDAAEERRGMFKTGGGPPPMITDPLSKKIIHMIPQQISPLPNPYDDDGAVERNTATETESPLTLMLDSWSNLPIEAYDRLFGESIPL